jgi:hypothetical protein
VRLVLRPLTLHAANAFVAAHHRHNKPARGCRFCLGAYLGGQLVGVAIVGRPASRHLDDGLTAEVTRLCSTGERNVCSFLYGAARRVWQTMGGLKVVTFTLASESGASLHAAGMDDVARVGGERTWSRSGRPRAEDAITREPKTRWEAS